MNHAEIAIGAVSRKLRFLSGKTGTFADQGTEAGLKEYETVLKIQEALANEMNPVNSSVLADTIRKNPPAYCINMPNAMDSANADSCIPKFHNSVLLFIYSYYSDVINQGKLHSNFSGKTSPPDPMFKVD